MPIGALRGLEALSEISKGRLFLLSSDKGHVSLSELEDLEQPELAFHGSFSMMVNFHAIAEFFRLQKGGVFLQELFDAFATGAFSLGFDLSQMPRLLSALEDTVGEFAPGHYYHLYDQFDNAVEKASLELIASWLRLSSAPSPRPCPARPTAPRARPARPGTRGPRSSWSWPRVGPAGAGAGCGGRRRRPPRARRRR